MVVFYRGAGGALPGGGGRPFKMSGAKKDPLKIGSAR